MKHKMKWNINQVDTDAISWRVIARHIWNRSIHQVILAIDSRHGRG